MQADKGADPDFLVGCRGADVARESHCPRATAGNRLAGQLRGHLPVAVRLQSIA